MGYYILQGEDTKGPYTLNQLRSMWNTGALTSETLFCQEGDSDWSKLESILSDLEPTPPPPTVTPPPTVKVYPVEPMHESTAKRRGRGLKLAGSLMMIVSVPGCMACSMAGDDSFMATGIYFFVFAAGFILFLAGRFND